MRTKIRLLASSLCLLFVQLSPNLAHAGKGSGGGNNDAAFALEEAMSLLPGLPMQELLVKLFEESAGRIPEVQVIKDGQGIPSEFGRFLPEGVSQSYSFFFPPANSSFDVYWEGELWNPRTLSLWREIQDRGPLDPQRYKRFPWRLQSTQGAQLTQAPSSTGLAFTYGDFGTIEFRQYTPKLTVFALYPSPTSGKCMNNNQYLQGPRKVCGVGYYW